MSLQNLVVDQCLTSEPTIVPIPMAECVTKREMKAANNSGDEPPAAMSVAPAT